MRDASSLSPIVYVGERSRAERRTNATGHLRVFVRVCVDERADHALPDSARRGATVSHANEEGKKGGYDVGLPRRGAPPFLQFKRTEKMVRNKASHAGEVGVPHYRMHLRPKRHSDQHELLLDLENQGHEVYYAAPRFHTSDELNEYFLNKRIADKRRSSCHRGWGRCRTTLTTTSLLVPAETSSASARGKRGLFMRFRRASCSSSASLLPRTGRTSS